MIINPLGYHFALLFIYNQKLGSACRGESRRSVAKTPPTGGAHMLLSYTLVSRETEKREALSPSRER